MKISALILILFASLLSCSAQHKTSVMNQQPECLESFKEIKLPFNSKDLFFFAIPDSVKAPYGEAFDEKLFSAHSYIPLPVQSPFKATDATVYPLGYKRQESLFIAFVMYTIKDPGCIEPQVKVYLIDKFCNKKDSLIIHNKYVWDSSELKNFKISGNWIITVRTETNIIEDEEKIITNDNTKHYTIDTKAGKFVLQ